MQPLFSPLRLGHVRLPNRLVLNALPSGLAAPDGRLTAQLREYYALRASGGAGLIVLEATYVLPPRDEVTSHIGLYTDDQVADLEACIRGVHERGAAVLVMLDQPLWLAHAPESELATIGQEFVKAAQRVRAAGADGVMLSAADGGPFEQLISPLQNQRNDRYGGNINARLKLLTDTLEALRRGGRFIVGVRLNAEEFAPGGLDLQEARMIASLLSGAGVSLIEICANKPRDALVAQFPGWQVPLAEGIKSVVDMPVMVGGLLDSPRLAAAVIRDRSADLIAVGERLRREPDWPLTVRAAFEP